MFNEVGLKWTDNENMYGYIMDCILWLLISSLEIAQ